MYLFWIGVCVRYLDRPWHSWWSHSNREPRTINQWTLLIQAAVSRLCPLSLVPVLYMLYLVHYLGGSAHAIQPDQFAFPQINPFPKRAPWPFPGDWLFTISSSDWKNTNADFFFICAIASYDMGSTWNYGSRRVESARLRTPPGRFNAHLG